MLQRCKLYACPSCYNPTIPLFVYSSNQERYQLKSIEEGAHFSFRVKFWMGQMTTTVIVYIKKINIVKIRIVQFYLWLQIACIVPARLVNFSLR